MISPQTIASLRSQSNKLIRSYLEERGHLEVETPLLSPYLIPEGPIEAFKCGFLMPYACKNGKRTPLFLIPSPELWMKRLLSQAWPSMFQISKAFRNCESVGEQHNPEFSILEWYTLDYSYLDQIPLTEGLLKALVPVFGEVRKKRPRLQSEQISVRELVRSCTGIDITDYPDRERFGKVIEDTGIQATEADDWSVLFDRLFLSRVEPHIPKDKMVFLYDYPVQVPCLAKKKKDGPFRERWELYLQGIEIANCYTEEDDPEEIKSFYENELRRKAQAQVPINPDYELLSLVEKLGFPASSGVALGVDRLIMALASISDIGGVILFPFSDILSSYNHP